MNDNGRCLIESVGGLLTHAWLDDYGFTDEERKIINEAINLLISVKCKNFKSSA